MAGLSAANFYGSDVGVTGTRTGVAAGVFANVSVGGAFSIEPQALYVQKGWSDKSGGATSTVKLDYVEVPVLLRFGFPLGADRRVVPGLLLGPAIAFRVKCHLQSSPNPGGGGGGDNCGTGGPGIKSTDFSLVFGAGVDIGPVDLQGRYDLGLTRIDSSSPPANVKNKAWLITLGFRF